MSEQNRLTDSQLWQMVLNQLQMRMTQATFDTWVRGSQLVSRDNGSIVIGTKNIFGKDWLENRLHKVISATITEITGQSLEIHYIVANDQVQDYQLELSGIRENEYSQEVKPDRVFVGTQYYRQVWLPKLGTNLWCLILELRQRCYWDHTTGEKRDTCKATYEELAEAVGISPRTAMRLLNSENANLFIVSRKVLRRFSNRQNKEVNETTLWTIRLDEPIWRDDEIIEDLST